MKTSKFLVALALPAMFAACTSEEIAVDAPLQNQEVVGAELVGTDISLFVEKDGIESRYNGNWELTDLLGLGWVVSGEYFDQQTETSTPGNVLFANHMFAKADASSPFSTKGNIYKGWHFAYYPYERMDGIGSKVVNVNPTQDCLWNATSGDRYHERFAISSKHFLTADDLKDNQLKAEKGFKMSWAVNEIAMNLIPSENFVNKAVLNDLAIQSVTLSNSVAVFAPWAKLVASAIPDATNKDGKSIYTSDKKVTDRVYDEDKSTEILLEKLPNVLTAAYYNNKGNLVDGYSKEITTTITADIKTGTGGYTRIFTLPYANGGVIEGITINPQIKVAVEGGYFLIKKENATDWDLNDKELAEANNEALDALVEAYEEDGDLAKVQGLIGLNLNLYAKIFHPDFTAIDDFNEWRKCVSIVDALGFTEEQVFNITGDIKMTSLTLPKKANIKVTSKNGKNDLGKKILVNKTLNWKNVDKLDVEDVEVVFNANNTLAKNLEAKNIVNNAVLTIGEGTSIEEMNEVEINENNGTIIVNKYALVTGVDNQNGRIEIIYGGIAETTAEGVIYYTVNGTEPAYKINYLMDNGNVNTFVVNENIEFDLTKKFTSGTFEDEYVPTPGLTNPIDAAALATKNIELIGGTIKGALNNVKAVKNIVAKASSTASAIIDIEINGNLTIEKGATIKVDATANNKGQKNETYVFGDIINEGTLNADNTIITTNLYNEVRNQSKIYVAENCVVYYGLTYKQGGSVEGSVLKLNSSSSTSNAIIVTEGIAVDVNENTFNKDNMDEYTATPGTKGTIIKDCKIVADEAIAKTKANLLVVENCKIKANTVLNVNSNDDAHNVFYNCEFIIPEGGKIVTYEGSGNTRVSFAGEIIVNGKKIESTNDLKPFIGEKVWYEYSKYF